MAVEEVAKLFSIYGDIEVVKESDSVFFVEFTFMCAAKGGKKQTIQYIQKASSSFDQIAEARAFIKAERFVCPPIQKRLPDSDEVSKELKSPVKTRNNKAK